MTEPKQQPTSPIVKPVQPFPQSRRGFYRMIAFKAILLGAIALTEAKITHPGVKMASCVVAIALNAVNDWEVQRLREEVEKRRRLGKE
jgi:hypothetical protein